MPSSKTTPAKTNTLFSYFNKTPKNDKQNNNDILTPKISPNTTKVNGDSSKKDENAFQKGDLLWSKLEGYPWWPSMVCGHPTSGTHFKRGKQAQVHVQFFDNPPSRAWIKTKHIKPFTGSDDKEFKTGGMFYTSNTDCRQGVDEADKALAMTVEDRLELVVELLPSEDEDEDEEEMAVAMDLDPDIFDGEMSEEEADKSDNSKENINKTPKKTPSKKDKRSCRSKVKRRKIIVCASDDDSGDEFKLKSDEEDSNAESESDSSSGVDEDDISEPDSVSEIDSPVKTPKNNAFTRKRKRPVPKRSESVKKKVGTNPPLSFPVTPKPSNSTPSVESSTVTPKPSSFTPSVGAKTKSLLASFSAADTVAETSQNNSGSSYPHVTLEFLQSDKIRDIHRRYKSDPDYDPKTLYVPEPFKQKCTPGMRQWWDLKEKHFDTVLFFKMGKFYELFHMDAVIGVNELGLIFMKGDHAHSGFPEIAYSRYADTLIQKGYKVARIEQTETPDMMEARCKSMLKPTKFDKVVRREVCRVTSRGTQTLNFLDGNCGDMQSHYLLAIAEKVDSSEGCSIFGVCFVDSSIGKVHIGQFSDDRHCSRLRTLLAHHCPTQILYERGKLSPKSLLVLNTSLPSVLKEALASVTEFWESSKTLKILAENNYFKNDDGNFQWPDVLKKMTSDVDSLGLNAADEYSLAVRALGAITWYLQYSLLDDEVLSMKNFEEYKPVDRSEVKQVNAADFATGKHHMVLDGITLANLDVIQNGATGTSEGSLLERIDHCCTPFGKRLIRQWLCAPLCNPSAINDRLNGIEELISAPEVVSKVTDMMKKLPDLARLLSRIHTLGSAGRSKDHPESRAIFYEEVTYSKRKIEMFLAVIEGFKVAKMLSGQFQELSKDFKSKTLKQAVTINSGENTGHFPDLKEELDFFETAFDHSQAKKDGVIVPNKGVNKEYDTAMADIIGVEEDLKEYLSKQRTRIGCKSITYWGTGKNRYQMEIPEVSWKNVPNDYELMSSKKGYRRYRTKGIESYLSELNDAEERKESALKDTMRTIFHSFDNSFTKWNAAVECLSVLDVLMSLAHYSKCGDGADICRPEFILPGNNVEPFIEIRDARHPCISRTFSGGDFIPNDTVIGIADENDMETDESNQQSKVVIVTGPNMGGKSTLMHQVGLVSIMAQLGCYVPAVKCRLTPVDRVFTRLGASDRIMAGESTFFVELSETSAILQHATKHSLVLMDELGRGTATYDGTAIACSVVQELSRNISCRTLFSTHYHSLVEEFSHDPNIRLGHMACMVENEDDDDPTQETITFLYKFTKGMCPKSYGFNAAKLANLPIEVIKVAVAKSKEFEESIDRIKFMKSIWKQTTADGIRALLCPS